MQHEITQAMPLLDSNGCLLEPGWARHPFWQYDRGQIKAPWYRIKEWDYYYILSAENNCGISITMSDLGYAGLFAICWLDFKSGKSFQEEALVLLPKGNLGLDQDSISSCVNLNHKDLSIDYKVVGQERKIIFCAPNMKAGGKQALQGELLLSSSVNDDSLNIATGWLKNPKSFYYNRKINCMLAKGRVQIADDEYIFTHENCTAGLDWGRGNWTYKNRWFWASANTPINGKPFGLNLGYGFSDRSMASENVIFYDGKAHKIDNVEFDFNEKNYLQSWQATSSDNRLCFSFTPILDRNSSMNLLLIRSVQHQVFGYFDGYAILDDGSKLEFKKMLGFAEDVFNCF